MSKDRSPPYDIPEAGRYYRCVWGSDEVGEIGVGDALGQVVGAAAGTLGSAKKSCEKPCIFL